MGTGRLPNLLVPGVPKAGTGSLFAYLTQHPDICGADVKEVGYFNYYNPRRHTGEPPGVDTYMQHFERCRNERYAIEATPSYSYGGQPVIDAIQQVLGRPKIILSLRNPVDRLWSAYTFQRTLGGIPGVADFDDYLAACLKRRRDGSDLVPRDHFHGLYIGYYEDYVGLWLDAFGPDMKVVFTEDMSRDSRGVLAGLFEWLEIDPHIVADLDLKPRKATRHARNLRVAKAANSLRSSNHLKIVPPGVRRAVRELYERGKSAELPEKMSPETRRQVEDIYRSSNEATGRALAAHGYSDLPAWLRATDPATAVRP